MAKNVDFMNGSSDIAKLTTDMPNATPKDTSPSALGVVKNEPISYFIFFAAYFLTAKLGQYLFFELHTSPAVIWPPTGIALAGVILYGWPMLIPIALAQLLAGLTRYGFVPISFLGAFAYTAQAAVAYFVLKSLRFSPTFERLRDALIFVSVAFSATTVGPGVATTVQALSLHTLTVTPLLNFGRAWAGGIFSVLIITPFILLWPPPKKMRPFSWRELAELIAAFAVLTLASVFIYTSPLAQNIGIVVIFIVPSVLLWFLTRFHPRWLAAALLLTAFLGVMGTIMANPSNLTDSQQLFSIELYLGIFAAIYLAFTTLVEERRQTSSELKHNISKLEKAVAKLSAQEKARTEFISVLAHELRNPLAPIVSAFEWLKLQQLPEDARSAVESADQQALMMERLLDDLLDTARVSQNKFKLHREYITLQECIQQSVAATADFYKTRRHTLAARIPQEPLSLFADAVRVKQMIINLLNNAGKYTEPGGRMELTCAATDGFATVSIKDNGIGIAADEFQNIFEPFRRMRLHPRFGTGLGIGLSLTKKLAEMHDGRVEVQSGGVDLGSTFTLYLPLADKALLPKAALAVPVQPQKAGLLRILVVDDNEAAARGLSKLLTHHGHTIHIAHNGEKALESVRSFKPDVVLLDIGLPDIDGYEVARRLRESHWNGPLVALTGYGLESDRNEAKQAGFTEHLTKPVGISDVINVLVQIQKPQLA